METSKTSQELQIDLPIYFGSQTGTASGFANDLAQEAVQYGVKPRIIDLENFDAEMFFKETLSVFIIATYGSGGPTTNAAKFHKWIKSSTDLNENSFKNKKIAIFGCGDKGFKRFNQMAKDITAKLVAYGAQKICETGTGDASQDIESDFIAWKKEFWSSFHPTDNGKKEEPNVTVIFEEDKINATDFSTTTFDLTTKQYIEASILLKHY